MVRLSAIFLCEEERRGDGDGLFVEDKAIWSWAFWC